MPPVRRMLRALRARTNYYALQILVLAAFALCGPAALAGPRGEGHTHGEEVAPAASAAPPRILMPGNSYDAVAISKNGRLALYVDRLSDSAPVTQASIELTSSAQTIQLKASSDATYVMDAGEIAQGGTHELTVSIQGPDGDDLVAGTIEIPMSGAHGEIAAVLDAPFAVEARVIISLMPKSGKPTQARSTTN